MPAAHDIRDDASEPDADGSLLGRAYELVAEDDERACEAIPDEACEEVPRNFFLNAANGACSKLAEQLASPALVLPWLLASLGAPTVFAGLLVPVKDAGSLLPQLAVSARIRAVAVRKWFWVVAGLTQSAALALMIPATALPSPTAAGAAIVGLLAVFSIASGVGSVAFKDVLGKTVPKGRRGRLLALRSIIGGVLALGAGLAVRTLVAGDADDALYLVLIGVAAGLWAASAVIFALMGEPPGSTKGGRNALAEARQGWTLLRQSPGMRRFLYARGLLVAIPVSFPFFALLAKDLPGSTLGSLGVFIIVNALAQIIGSPIWGRFADRSARKVMIAAGVLAAAAGAAAVGLTLAPDAWRTAWTFAPVLLLLGVAYAGARLGRKTWLVDAAPKDQRPLYVAVSNTAIGVVVLAAGLMGVVAQFIGAAATVGVLAAVCLAGAAAAAAMPEADTFSPQPEP